MPRFFLFFLSLSAIISCSVMTRHFPKSPAARLIASSICLISISSRFTFTCSASIQLASSCLTLSFSISSQSIHLPHSRWIARSLHLIVTGSTPLSLSFSSFLCSPLSRASFSPSSSSKLTQASDGLIPSQFHFLNHPYLVRAQQHASLPLPLVLLCSPLFSRSISLLVITGLLNRAQANGGLTELQPPLNVPTHALSFRLLLGLASSLAPHYSTLPSPSRFSLLARFPLYLKCFLSPCLPLHTFSL